MKKVYVPKQSRLAIWPTRDQVATEGLVFAALLLIGMFAICVTP